MKRLDKPTNSQSDNLLNIKKITFVSVKILSNGKFSKYLTSKKEFLCIYVFRANSTKFSQIHLHPKLTTQQSIVKGEI
jgi:hypothetical protein